MTAENDLIDREAPGVSYIMPVLNEELYLDDAVRAVLGQEYGGPQEVVLAVAPSNDASLEIAQNLAARDARIIVLQNPDGDIPAGLNLALSASRYDVIIRVDAHSTLMKGYTCRAVRVLEETGAANVGGIMQARGHGPVQQAIARAYNSPFGLGGGRYHSAGEAGPAESAYLGVFQRDALEEVGGFDPSIRRGEDWELNLRLRRRGFLVWFDPGLHVTYWPRVTFTQLAQQFFATGVWRAALVRRYPREHPWRFFVPGLLVVGLATSLVIASLQLVGILPRGLRWFSFVHFGVIAYALAVLIGTVTMRGKSLSDRILNYRALVTMHIAWGAGFLAGLVRGAKRTVDRSRMRKTRVRPR